jgi:predicted permease
LSIIAKQEITSQESNSGGDDSSSSSLSLIALSAFAATIVGITTFLALKKLLTKREDDCYVAMKSSATNINELK